MTLHASELQKARTMRARSAESAACRWEPFRTVNCEEIVNYGELYLLPLARNRELPYSNFRRKEKGSNEAESKSPLQPANTANVADSLPPATPPLFALRRGDSSPRLAVASRKRALGSPSLGSFFFCRRTGRHPARIAVHRSSRTVPQPRRSLWRGCWAWPPQSLVRRAASIDACGAPCFLAWGSIHNHRSECFT